MQKLKDLIIEFEGQLKQEITGIAAMNPKRLYEPIAYSLTLGGKRIRPALMLHAASLFSEEIAHVVPAAIAIEVFHNFTLLHDDIMDHADLRRGTPTIHKKYGENTAILSGDAMSIMAFSYLSKTDVTKLPELLTLFSNTALEVCEGQQYDMEFESRDNVTIDQYMEMIRLKTAVLIAASLKIGAILANASERDARLLYDYGINIGLAFQLQDDWLDVYGDEATFGKKIGGDILENKKTYLLLKALELSKREKLASLNQWISATNFDATEKIAEVTRIFTESGASDATKSRMQFYHNKAIDCLSLIELPEPKKAELTAFAGTVLSRVK
jgi:geranylgeranyl diphosphate synthase type II